MENFVNPIIKAMDSVKNAQLKAKTCPYRPQYHFIAPAQWMNDPNGTIYYKGEFHLFYQHNPFKTTWGSMHWGHAKSKDLVHWEHLPIALAPSYEKGEKHCFSGCCVNNNGVPSIIYTSIASKIKVIKGAEQWLATSDDDMLTWTKYEGNPIMTDDLHGYVKIRQWRDPYVWRENKHWFAVLGGHLKGTGYGATFLYQSENLKTWRYIGVLCEGTPEQGHNWECPNFFPIDQKHMLIISPHSQVLYALGKYKDYKFSPEHWGVLDFGRPYYATNTLFDEKKRILLFGWISHGWLKDVKLTGWNGCTSLPRVLDLNPGGNLTIRPAPELNILRGRHTHMEDLEIDSASPLTVKANHTNRLQIIAKIKPTAATQIGFHLINCTKEVFIGLDLDHHMIIAGEESGQIPPLKSAELIDLTIFIDQSVIEMFLNNEFCITGLFYPQLDLNQSLELRTSGGPVQVPLLDIWEMESIWE
ncbi:MAG: glycoside hydrolase family 32 protein [Candidatus Helarchaeota archaeon]